MSETSTQTGSEAVATAGTDATQTNSAQTQDAATETTPKTYDEEYVKGLREEAAKNRVKLKEYEDRDKTEEQKRAERVKELEVENQRYKLAEQRQVWAKDITEGSHIPASALRGDTEDELRAHFAELKTLIPEPSTRTVVPGDAERQALALNGDGLETALLAALKR